MYSTSSIEPQIVESILQQVSNQIKIYMTCIEPQTLKNVWCVKYPTAECKLYTVSRKEPNLVNLSAFTRNEWISLKVYILRTTLFI